MSTLPTGWITARFGDINSFVSRTINPSTCPDELFELYSVPAFSTREPEHLPGSAIGSTKQCVQPDDVLVCKINPRINRVWQVRPKGAYAQIASSEWIVLRTELNSPEYLRYYFSSPAFREMICDGVTGVGGSLTRAQPKRVAAFPVPLAPLAEQKRIADKLDTLFARLDACRDRLDRVPEILQRFRRAVLAAATSGELTREWREERGLEGRWTSTTVGEVAAQVFDGPFGSHLKSQDYVDEGVRVVRLENIASLRFVEEKRTYITKAKFQGLVKHTLRADDILFSSFVDEEVRVCLLPQHLGGSAINKADCFCIRTSPDQCRPHFLVLRLACASTFAAIQDMVHGATRPRVNLGQLKAIRFSLPSIAEQDEIVRRCAALLGLTTHLEERLVAIRSHVQNAAPALLAKAFRGELSSHSPKDSPASNLLTRARQAAARTSKTTSTARGHTRGRVNRTSRTDTVLDGAHVSRAHLSQILRARGPLDAEALWAASQLAIEDFYEQLADEEGRGLLREVAVDSPHAVRRLEAAS